MDISTPILYNFILIASRHGPPYYFHVITETPLGKEPTLISGYFSALISWIHKSDELVTLDVGLGDERFAICAQDELMVVLGFPDPLVFDRVTRNKVFATAQIILNTFRQHFNSVIPEHRYLNEKERLIFSEIITQELYLDSFARESLTLVNLVRSYILSEKNDVLDSIPTKIWEVVLNLNAERFLRHV